MEAHTEPLSRRNALLWRVGTAGFFSALLAVALLNLPRGFDTDLTRIGSGKPAVVFIYDPNLVVSNQQTVAMDQARQALGDAVHFLVADVGKPDTRHFMERHDARRTQLLLLSANGNEVDRMQALVPAEALVAAVEAANRPR